MNVTQVQRHARRLIEPSRIWYQPQLVSESDPRRNAALHSLYCMRSTSAAEDRDARRPDLSYISYLVRHN